MFMDGKRILLWLIVIGCGLLGILEFFNGERTIWGLWSLPNMEQSFADLRNLTGAGESIDRGYDPLYHNPGDPWGRPLNHPRIVQYLLQAFHINLGSTSYLGILFGFLFFLGAWVAFPKLDRLSAYGIGLLLFSPIAALGIERGNHDLFIFFLVAIALRAGQWAWVSLPLMFLAASIKLFPVFGIFYAARYKAQQRIIGGFLLLFISYLALNYRDLLQIFSSTQKGHYLWAYGVKTFDEAATGYAYIPAGATIVATVLFYLNGLSQWQPNDASGSILHQSTYLDGFCIGSGIYLGTFLLGNSWAYRLIFLIFTVPQLVAWIKTDRYRRLLSIATSFSTIVVCCPSWIGSGIIDELFDWLLFICLLYLWLSVLPLPWQNWLRCLPLYQR
jgi:hypothetical protein